MSDARFQNLLSRDEALLDRNHSVSEMLSKPAGSWEEQKFGVENVPVGQSTPFLSPPQTVGPDPVHDLPAELLQIGWRRFWSKREGRPYFFNKLTNESLWEMPRLSTPTQYDPLTDPLGIQGPPTPVDPGTPPGPSHHLLPSPPPASSPVLLPRPDKRRASDDANPAAAKKFVLSGTVNGIIESVDCSQQLLLGKRNKEGKCRWLASAGHHELP